MADDGLEWTTEEREILEKIAGNRGADYAEANAELSLAQARLVGDI